MARSLAPRLAALACLLVAGFARADAPTGPSQVPSPKSKPAAPYLWKITSPQGGAASWIFGTIHLQRPDVARPPAAVLAALDHADAVYTEIQMDPATLLGLLPRMQLPAGKSLGSILGEKTSADLDRELKSIDPSLGLAAVANLRPWVAAATLLEIEDQIKYPASLPLDLLLFQRAAMAGKETGGLEAPEEQLALFDDLTDAEQAEMVRDTIIQIRAIRTNGQSPTEMLTQLYLAGDLDALVAKLNELDSGGGDPALNAKLMDRMLYRRNATMAARLIEKLRAHPEKSYFIAVGAAHLQGDRGLLAALEKAGFQLNRAQ